MDILKEGKNFQVLIRENINEVLKPNSYELIFDNSRENQQISKNWVFKLVYKGEKTIEIYNDDWRDYTEYFNVSVDGKEMFYVKINEYENLTKAFKELKLKIQKIL
jgi:hypothetical protein